MLSHIVSRLCSAALSAVLVRSRLSLADSVTIVSWLSRVVPHVTLGRLLADTQMAISCVSRNRPSVNAWLNVPRSFLDHRLGTSQLRFGSRPRILGRILALSRLALDHSYSPATRSYSVQRLSRHLAIGARPTLDHHSAISRSCLRRLATISQSCLAMASQLFLCHLHPAAGGPSVRPTLFGGLSPSSQGYKECESERHRLLLKGDRP